MDEGAMGMGVGEKVKRGKDGGQALVSSQLNKQLA
jgi:hypothetical protein